MSKRGHVIRDRRVGGFAWRESEQPAVELPAMLLLHGLGGSRIAWESQLGCLGDRVHLLAWDMPGYGESDPLPGTTTFAALAESVLSFADVAGVSSFHLVGLSLGGMIAQYVAALRPQRLCSLTLLATSPKFGLDGTDPVSWRAARLAPLDAGLEPSDFADRVLGALAGPNITEAALAQQRAAMTRISGAALRRVVDCLVTHDSTSILSQITAPTRCVVGALDTETPPEYAQEIAKRISGARVDVIPGAGHLLNAEAPEPINAILLEQVEQVGQNR